MKIEKNKVVVLTYELDVEGRVVDRATAERPLDYIQGMHMLIPRFEQEVEGLEPGAAFAFTLPPEEGYGPYDDSKRKPLPKEAFTINGEVREDLMEVGRLLPLVNGYGEVVQAVVTEVRENDVVMDFNHPMAGKTLHFTGTVLSVREATEKELAEGLHGEFLPPEEEHHCCHGHGKGHCRHGEGHHHEDGHCCHGEGHGHEEGHCCHGEGEHCQRED